MPIPAAALALAGEAAGGAAGAAGAAGGGAAGGAGALFGQLGGQVGQLGAQVQSAIPKFQSLTSQITGLTGKLNPLTMATQFVSDQFHKLTRTFYVLSSIVTETVGLFHPLSLLQFNRALMDLKAVFGQIFKPVLVEVTGLLRTLANYFYSLPASFKGIIASLARTTAVAGVIATLGSLFVTLGGAMVSVKAVFGPIVYLFEQFKNTLGGAGALRDALRLVEDIFGGIVSSIQTAWAATAGVRETLSRELGRLGSAFSELFNTMRPLFGGQMAIWIGTVTVLIHLQISAWIALADFIKNVTRGLNFLLSPLSKLLGLAGFKLPDLSRPTKDATGLGYGGASVTDPVSLYNRLTEEIARGSRPEEKSPVEKIAEDTGQMVGLLTDIKNAVTGKKQETIEGGQGFAEGLGLAGPIFRGVREFFK